MHDLVQLNYRFGEAEVEAENEATKEQSEAFFKRHLHEKLVFRRAGGAVVTKQEFLTDLASPDNRTDQLSSYVLEVTESEDGETAEALVLVHLKGKRKGEDATGLYRNRRLFVKQKNGDWQCLVWFNTRITPV